MTAFFNWITEFLAKLFTRLLETAQEFMRWLIDWFFELAADFLFKWVEQFAQQMPDFAPALNAIVSYAPMVNYYLPLNEFIALFTGWAVLASAVYPAKLLFRVVRG